jgi:Bacterial Ig-like domain (group 3)
MSKRTIIRVIAALFVTLVFSLAFAAPLAAATRTWTGTASALWSNAGNWSGGVVPSTFDDLVFPAGALNQTNTNNLQAGSFFSSITFTGGAYTVTGNAISLGAGGLSSSSPANGYQSFMLDVTLGADQTWVMTPSVSGGLNLIMKGSTDLNGKALTCTYANSTADYWEGAITGAGSLTLSGNANPYLRAANTATAPLTVDTLLFVKQSYPGPITVTGSQHELGLDGGATVGSVTVNDGVFFPGISGGRSQTGNLSLGGGSRFGANINGTTAGTFSQVAVTGTVAIEGSFLNLYGTAVPAGSTFVLIDNDGTDPIVGTFANLPEGSTLPSYQAQQVFSISYVGGTGNDVVLTAEGLVPSTSISLSSSPNPSTFRDLVTIDATVTSSAGTPTGTVYFQDGGSVMGVASVGAGGIASFQTAALTQGAHVLTAQFSGNGAFVGGLSNSPALNQLVNAGPSILIVPSSAHAAGANGAFYTTDLTVSNTRATAAAFTLKFLGHDQDGTTGPEQEITLAAGETRTFPDVLGSVFSLASGFGALRVSSTSGGLVALAQTSTPGFGGTFGQSVPAADEATFVHPGDFSDIVAVREDDAFRTNLILCNAAAAPLDVYISLRSADGVALGSKIYSLLPLGMTQISRVVRDLGVTASTVGARLSIGGNGVFAAYASVIDNVTNDPRTLLPQSPDYSQPSPFTWILPSSARATGANGAFYTTDLTIASTGPDGDVTIKFLAHDQDGTGAPSHTFHIPSGKTVTYADVVNSVFGLDSTYGALTVTTPNTGYWAVLGQTSTPGFGGTFGQSVPRQNPIASHESPSILGVREDGSFRTNLILCNAKGASAQIDVALVAASGTTLASKRYSFAPLQMTQVTRVVRDLGITGDVSGARLVLSPVGEGSAFAAYAAVIDNVTNDPRTLLPR